MWWTEYYGEMTNDGGVSSRIAGEDRETGIGGDKNRNSEKKGKFRLPEKTTLDAMRVLIWEDLPSPTEEVPIKFDAQGTLFDKNAETEQSESDDEE